MKEKNIISKMLLLMCTALATFVTLSGTFTISTVNDLLWQLLFLPITVFLIISTINTFLYKGTFALPDLHTSSGKANLVVAILIFAIFFVIGVSKVISKNDKLSGDKMSSEPVILAVSTPTPVTPSEADSSPELQATILSEDVKILINVRRDANDKSSVLAQVKNGEVYEILEKGDGWVKIKVNEEVSGWIADKFILN